MYKERRNHRAEVLNDIEAELDIIRRKMTSNGVDSILWKCKSGFKNSFSSKETWLMLRETYDECSWTRGVWFSKATPKFAFITWLAMLDRLSTMERVAKWSQGIDTTCVLCQAATESRSHLFFECSYSTQLWSHLTLGILRSNYSCSWDYIVALISGNSISKLSMFCVRYSFQAALYAIWRERNKVRHGKKLLPITVLMKLVEKGVRNRLSLMRKNKGRRLEGALQYWFETRV